MRTARFGLAGMALVLAGCASQAGSPPSSPLAPLPTTPLSMMYGEWRGTAKVAGRDGAPIDLIQTERVGPMVNGDATVIEGRGYGAAGDLQFNAFAVVSKNAQTGAWEMRSYSGGNSGTFPFEPKPDGFVWSTPAGPGASTRYTATIANGRWDQIGEYVPKDGEPRQVFEMHLTRIGNTSWPASGFVGPAPK
jgi:hypothetical protein